MAKNIPSDPGRLGIDIGRVIMCPTDDDGRPDTSFLSADEPGALATPAAPGLYEVLPGLIRAFSSNVWLVSKAGPRIEKLTLKWLRHNDFYNRTGLRPDRVCFCRKREEKQIYARRHGLTHFIDDRVDVLEHLRNVVPHLVLFGVQTSPIPPWVTPALDWPSVPTALRLGKADEATLDKGCQPHSVR